MHTISVVNSKGGVGKTTTVAVLASILEARDYSVARIDLDPMGCLGLLAEHVQRVEPDALPNVLASLGGMDFTVIDTPPSLGRAVRVACDVSDGLIIPVIAEFVILRALANLMAMIPTEKIICACVTGFRGHVAHQRLVLQRIEALGYPVITVPYSIAAADAQLAGRDLRSDSRAKARRIPEAYERLTDEVERWRKRTG